MSNEKKTKKDIIITEKDAERAVKKELKATEKEEKKELKTEKKTVKKEAKEAEKLEKKGEKSIKKAKKDEEKSLERAKKDEYNSKPEVIAEKKRTKGRVAKAAVLSGVGTLFGMPLIAMPLSTLLIYEGIYGRRHKTKKHLEFKASEFEGLKTERSDFFEKDGARIAGYKYWKEDGKEKKGVVIVSHGLGHGGHNSYMPFVNEFASNGYYVFTYDTRGNDNSQGITLKGLPQGIISLSYAIEHLAEIEEYKNLPVMLFGHSWGAFSVGNVLNVHPEVSAAVIVAGFNESEDVMLNFSGKVFGPLADGLMTYVDLYEKLKFGKQVAKFSAINGMKNTNALIMITHSKDDKIVPYRFGYAKFYKEFKENERFTFISHEKRGHTGILYAPEAKKYEEEFENEYKAYLKRTGRKNNEKTKSEYTKFHFDKLRAFKPDPKLIKSALELYEKALTREASKPLMLTE